MAQHDQDLSNQPGAAFRADTNNALAALFSNSSGTTEPSVKLSYQWWADTTTGLLKIRNAANNAWVTVGTMATAGFGIAPDAASQSQQEAGSSSAVYVTPLVQHHHRSAAKGWCMADASGASVASYNVASVTDVGVGDSLVTWTTSMSSASYAAVVSAKSDAGLLGTLSNASFAAGTTRCLVFAVGGTPTDPNHYMFAVFGDQ